MSSIDTGLLHIGSIVLYKLLPCQIPTNPTKVWRAKVVRYYPLVKMCYVEILEPGYAGLHEYIWYEQVVSIS